jgi:peptidoglycan hydrolase-like protein with peptidoglycan-binding domain
VNKLNFQAEPFHDRRAFNHDTQGEAEAEQYVKVYATGPARVPQYGYAYSHPHSMIRYGGNRYFRNRRWSWLHRRDWRRWDQGGDGGQDPTILEAQSCLAQVIGPWVPQDGRLGPETQRAIQTFQQQAQLPPTGVIDDATMSALQTSCSSTGGAQ